MRLNILYVTYNTNEHKQQKQFKCSTVNTRTLWRLPAPRTGRCCWWRLVKVVVWCTWWCRPSVFRSRWRLDDEPPLNLLKRLFCFWRFFAVFPRLPRCARLSRAGIDHLLYKWNLSLNLWSELPGAGSYCRILGFILSYLLNHYFNFSNFIHVKFTHKIISYINLLPNYQSLNYQFANISA